MAGDITDEKSVNRALDGVDTVYHLAGRLAGSSWRELADVNVYGTRVLARASAQSTTVERVLLSSSVVVYPQRFQPWAWPLSERSPVGVSGRAPDRAYALSKIRAEEELRRAAARSGFSYTIVRSVMSYGVSSEYSETLVRSLVLRPPAPGSALARTMLQPIHVEDLARAVVAAGMRSETEGEVVNIAGEEPISYLDLSRLARRLVRAQKDVSRPSRSPRHQWPGRAPYDTGKAAARLGFQPTVSLARGLDEVIASVRLSRPRPA